MYRFAYSAICFDQPASALPPHNLRLLDAIELFEAADRAAGTSHERLQLLSDFRRLWLSVELPEHLQAANSVLEEIERRRFTGNEERPASRARRIWSR
ncbi:MAG: hypothetical protein HY765_08030 [Rhodomicrobium sp.]|nr:hypothetical protein [Rhodomicrobium sp.]